MGVGGQRHAPAVLTRGKSQYPSHMRLCGPQGRSGLERKISPPEFDPRTVQPVASRNTDCVIRPKFTRHHTKINCHDGLAPPALCTTALRNGLWFKWTSTATFFPISVYGTYPEAALNLVYTLLEQLV